MIRWNVHIWKFRVMFNFLLIDRFLIFGLISRGEDYIFTTLKNDGLPDNCFGGFSGLPFN